MSADRTTPSVGRPPDGAIHVDIGIILGRGKSVQLAVARCRRTAGPRRRRRTAGMRRFSVAGDRPTTQAVARMNWDRARRQDGVPRRGNDVPHGNFETPDWRSAPRGPWISGEELGVPTCPGTVSFATRARNGVVHVQWTPEAGRARRIAADQGEAVLYELRRRGVKYRPLGKSAVAAVPRDRDRDDALDLFGAPGFNGCCLGARWELLEDEGLWWIRVNRTRMPLDALVWRLFHHSDKD